MLPENESTETSEHGIIDASYKEENSMVFETKIRDNCTEFLPFIQRIINATPHSITKVAPVIVW